MFDHYIGVDWAQTNMAIARMTKVSDRIKTIDVPSSIKELQLYLNQLKGTKVLVIEESTTSQWLYTELVNFVDKLIVCDPRRNRLLSEGPKSDKIDAEKLVKLLRAGLLKPVYHSGHHFVYMRRLVSGYLDVVAAGVRLQNQRHALYRANGQKLKDGSLDHDCDKFVVWGLDSQIELYKEEKKRYNDEFERLNKKHKILKNLKSIPGIKDIGAIKIASRVVDPRRFATKGDFLSYSGLIKHDRVSGGKSYGKKKPMYCRTLKNVFDVAATACIQESVNNPLKDYYTYLKTEKRYADHNARHAVARRAAVLAWGVMKTGEKYDPGRGKGKDSIKN